MYTYIDTDKRERKERSALVIARRLAAKRVAAAPSLCVCIACALSDLKEVHQETERRAMY